MFKKIVILTSLLLPGSILAAPLGFLLDTNQTIIGISAGPTWSSGNKKQTLNLQPDIVKTYTADSNDHVFPSAEFFLGWQQPFSVMQQSLLGQLGISIAGSDHAEMSGDIWEDADPTFDNFDYTYKVNRILAAVKGRLVGSCNRFVEPYVSASLGVSFNRAYEFQIDPIISQEVPAPAFKSNTKASFSYTLGIGLQKSFTPQFQAAIGYEFSDWGKTQFSHATGQTVNKGLSLNHVYAQQLQLSVFYLV